MSLSVPVDGVSLNGGTSPGIRTSADALVLTGDGHVTPASMLGLIVSEITEEPDMFRYRIEVDGTSIRENYEYKEHKKASFVAADWLTDVKENWGGEMADAFRDNVTVTDLWRETTVDPDSEGHKDSQEESQKNEKAPLGSAENPLVMPPPEETDTGE